MLSQASFRPRIIEVLASLGGEAPKAAVITQLEEMLVDELTTEDRQLLLSRREAHWSNRASWERNAMVDDGLLVRRSDGIWQLTEAGEEASASAKATVPGASHTRNPSWVVDELILALDLYLREGQLAKSDGHVVDLSAILNEWDCRVFR
jgi:restriction endonuclease Mrr